MEQEFYRIKRLPPYVFAEVNDMKAKARAEGEDIRNVYRRRRDDLVESFSAAGWQVPQPSATMFAWAAIPQQFANFSSLEFSKMLLSEAKVAVSPGLGFGEYGEGFVRIALVENRHRIRQAARNIRKFLSHVGDSPSAAREQALAQ